MAEEPTTDLDELRRNAQEALDAAKQAAEAYLSALPDIDDDADADDDPCARAEPGCADFCNQITTIMFPPGPTRDQKRKQCCRSCPVPLQDNAYQA